MGSPIRVNCDLSIAFVEICRRMPAGATITFDDVRDAVPTTSSLATMRRNGWVDRVKGKPSRKTHYKIRLSPYIAAQKVKDDPRFSFVDK